jgi:hypothetical protein
MSGDFFSAFEQDKPYPFPGKRPPVVGPAPQREVGEWWSTPIKKTIGGKEIEFYTIGQLAEALGLRPVTVRKWESRGWLPQPIVRMPPPRKGGLPDKKVKGRRLWTRVQVEGIVRIAREESMLGPANQVPRDKTVFTQRIVALYRETMREIKEQ